MRRRAGSGATLSPLFLKDEGLMPDTCKYFAVRHFTPVATHSDGLFGIPIVAPIDCTQVVIENGDAVNAQTVRSDPENGETEKIITGSLELTLRFHSSGDPVIQRGDVVCRIAPVAGNGPVIVTFIR
jgi:hypothetical protein